MFLENVGHGKNVRPKGSRLLRMDVNGFLSHEELFSNIPIAVPADDLTRHLNFSTGESFVAQTCA